MSDNNKIIFVNMITNLAKTETPFKITFSKPRHKNKEITNVYVKPSIIKNEIQYSFTNRYRYKDEVKNYTAGQLAEVINNLLETMFFNAVSFSDTKEVSFLQSKKGVGTVLTKYHKTPVGIELSHDHEKTRYISANSQWLIDLGLATQEGKIYNKAQDKFKQINKYVELLAHLLIDYPIDKNIKIADMGSGKGYLTFALYEFLIKTKNLRCRMTGYEIREDIVTLCNQVALKNEFVGLNFQQKSIEDTIVDDVDMVIALHACNIATDMAIVKGIQAGSQYIIVAPCCHKQVRSAMKHENDLTPILKHGIMEERQAELLTDGIRSLMLEAYGYKTQIFEFISTEHTSKNIMITGVKKTGFNPDMIEKIEKIKILFGIDYHYLQKSMEEWENNKGA